MPLPSRLLSADLAGLADDTQRCVQFNAAVDRAMPDRCMSRVNDRFRRGSRRSAPWILRRGSPTTRNRLSTAMLTASQLRRQAAPTKVPALHVLERNLRKASELMLIDGVLLTVKLEAERPSVSPQTSPLVKSWRGRSKAHARRHL